MRSDVISKLLECILSMVVPSVRKFFEEFEITACIHYLIFNEYLIVTDAYDVRCSPSTIDPPPVLFDTSTELNFATGRRRFFIWSFSCWR